MGFKHIFCTLLIALVSIVAFAQDELMESDLNDSILVASAIDSSQLISIEGLIIDTITGESPSCASLIIQVNALFAECNEGNFSVLVPRSSAYIISVQGQGFAPVISSLPDEPGKRNYFATCRIGKSSNQSSVAPTVVAAPTTSKIPWTVSGTIIDSRFELPIKAASISLTFDSLQVQTSKLAGFVVKCYNGGVHLFKVTIPGFQTITQAIELTDSDKQPFITIPTAPVNQSVKRREITVTAKRESLHSTATVNQTKITRQEAINTAATTNDPIRVLHTLPGVASQSDMAAQPIVRGGDVFESRIFMDGIPLLQPYHYGGARSTVNQLAMDHIEFYKSGFPAKYENAQSAIIAVESRKAIPPAYHGDIDLNVLQGTLYLQFPLVRNVLGLNASFQGSWQDFVYKRVIERMPTLGDEESIRQLKEEINLPDYRDGSVGLGWQVTPQLRVSVAEFIHSDLSKSLRLPPSVIPDDSREDTTDESAADTNFVYRSYYNILTMNSTYLPDAKNVVNSTIAWQKRWWDLDIPDLLSVSGTPKYNVNIDQANVSGGWIHSGIDKHLLEAGFQVNLTHSTFDVDMLRALHQVIVEGSTNLGDFIGPLTGDSGSTSLSQNSVNVFGNGSLFMSMFYLYKGSKTYLSAGAYFQDSWEPTPRLSLNLGGRMEFSTVDRALNFSPRFSARYKDTETHELIGALGHYSQNNYDIASIALSEELKPEKVWHLSIGEERRLLPWLTHKVDIYGKYYFDLTSEMLGPDWNKIIGNLTGPDYERYQRMIDSLLNSESPNPDESLRLMDSLLGGDLILSRYTNNGKGLGGGVEWGLKYDPADFWNGWLSVTVNHSIRQRFPGWRWHSFPQDRPLILSLVNFYRLPRQYEVSVKYRYMSGIPYTWYSLSDSTSGLNKYNSDRYASYQRIDLRFTKGFSLFKGKGHTYLEVWNAFNTPNFYLVDSKTREARMIDLNWPITFIFIGFDYSF